MKIYQDYIHIKMKRQIEHPEPLTDEEIIYLESLINTLKHFNQSISLKAYSDNSTCLIKRNGLWELYQIINSYRINKAIFNDIKDACQEIILSLNDKEALIIMNNYLSEEHPLEQIVSFQIKNGLLRETPKQLKKIMN